MTPDSFVSSRRDVMKAVGAGSVLAALGGAAVVGGRDDRGDDVGAGAVERDDRVRQIQQTGSVHTIRPMIGPSTSPERPADFFYQPTGLHVQPGDVLRFEFVTPDHNVVSYHPAFGMRRRVPLGVSAISSPLMGWRPDTIPGDMVDPPAVMGEEPPEETPAATDTPAGTGTDTPAETATDTPAETATDTPAGTDGDTPTGTATEMPTGTPGDGAAGPVPNVWLLALDAPGVYDFLCSPHEHFGMALRVVVGDETDAPFETEDPAALPQPRVGPVGLARVTLTDPALQPEAIVEQGSVAWEALEANQDGEGTPAGTPGGTATPGDGNGTGTETGTPGP